MHASSVRSTSIGARDGFYAQRSNSNPVRFPQRHFSIELRTIGFDGLALNSSADHTTELIESIMQT